MSVSADYKFQGVFCILYNIDSVIKILHKISANLPLESEKPLKRFAKLIQLLFLINTKRWKQPKYSAEQNEQQIKSIDVWQVIAGGYAGEQ